MKKSREFLELQKLHLELSIHVCFPGGGFHIDVFRGSVSLKALGPCFFMGLFATARETISVWH